MHAIPTCQAITAASGSGIRWRALKNAGPSTVKAIPMVLGASRPSGIAAPLAGRQPEREPGVDEVAEEHAQGGAREHARVDQLFGKAEDEDEDAGQDHEVHHVVQHQAEERVDVAGRRPAIAGAVHAHLARRGS
jgi:hypothetical protein